MEEFSPEKRQENVFFPRTKRFKSQGTAAQWLNQWQSEARKQNEKLNVLKKFRKAVLVEVCSCQFGQEMVMNGRKCSHSTLRFLM